MSKPAALETFSDPTFGTKITRVTNAPAGKAHRTLYNTVQPWNADERYLMLYHTGDSNAGHHLYDGRTYRYLQAMKFSASDIEGIYWDNEDWKSLYFVQKRPVDDELYGKLVKYDISTRKRSLVADLTPMCGDPRSGDRKLAKGGNDIQGMHGKLIGLRCQKNNSYDISFSINVENGEISNSVALDPTRPQGNNGNGFRPNVAAAPLPSGQRVLVQDAVYDSNMNYLYQMDAAIEGYSLPDGRTYPVPKLEHSSIGRMPNGNDALFTPSFNAPQNGCDSDSDFGVGSLIAYDLVNASCDVVIGPSTGWDFPLNTVHVSAVSKQKPGWVTMTAVGNGRLQYLSNAQAAPVFMSELTVTYADPDNPTTCRLAHVRTHGYEASRGGSYRGGYFGEPHAVMSPSGTRVIFNSDWHDSGSVDAYVADLSGAFAQVQSQALAVEQTDARGAFQLNVDVHLDESPARVYVDFENDTNSAQDRIAISRAGSPDSHRLMRLYTNGSQMVENSGPSSGRLPFRQKYIGVGEFEARLYLGDDFDNVVHRSRFTVGM